MTRRGGVQESNSARLLIPMFCFYLVECGTLLYRLHMLHMYLTPLYLQSASGIFLNCSSQLILV